MVRIIALLAIVGGCFLGASRQALAQESTPAGGIVPHPAECQVEPRTVADVTALWAVAATPTGRADSGTPEADLGPVTGRPMGEPADSATTAAVTATVRQFVACTNAADFLRVLSLYSDDLVAAVVLQPNADLIDLEALLAMTPTPFAEDEWATLVAVTDVTILDDGQVVAVVISINPQRDRTAEQTSLLYFVEQDGQWRIDEIIAEISLDPVASPSE